MPQKASLRPVARSNEQREQRPDHARHDVVVDPESREVINRENDVRAQSAFPRQRRLAVDGHVGGDQCVLDIALVRCWSNANSRSRCRPIAWWRKLSRIRSTKLVSFALEARRERVGDVAGDIFQREGLGAHAGDGGGEGTESCQVDHSPLETDWRTQDAMGRNSGNRVASAEPRENHLILSNDYRKS